MPNLWSLYWTRHVYDIKVGIRVKNRLEWYNDEEKNPAKGKQNAFPETDNALSTVKVVEFIYM